MSGNGESRLSRCKVHRYRKRAVVGQCPVNWIGDELSTVGHREACVSAEGDWCQGTAVDRSGSYRSVCRPGDCHRGYIEVVNAKDVGEPKPEGTTAVGYLERLSNRGIEEDSGRAVERRRWKVGGFHQLGHSRPGADPVTPGRILRMSLGEAVALSVVPCSWGESSGQDGETAYCK